MNRLESDQDIAKAEIQRLKDELRSKNDMYLRALADFDNYRKRIERDQESTARRGRREMVMALLQVLDDFDRAVEHAASDPSSVLEGVQAIHRRLLDQLEAQGITAFQSRGEVFDPRMHEAVASVESERDEPGRIVDELQKGYRWGDEILRPARVTVAR